MAADLQCYRYANGSVGSGIECSVPVAYELTIIPEGEWYDCGQRLQRRDARRFWISLIDGSLSSELIRGYYHRITEAYSDRDICLYCGADTTAARVGWDCYNCEGN